MIEIKRISRTFNYTNLKYEYHALLINYTNLKYVQLYGIEPPHVETEFTQQAPKPWAHDPRNDDL